MVTYKIVLPPGNFTQGIKMVPKRKNKVEAPYQSCPLKSCMDLIGGAWTVNIIWFLSEEPRRFSELKSDLEGISSKVLTAKLKKMESQGIVLRKEVKSSPPTVEYSLTKLGGRLKPAIASIVEVGHDLKYSNK